MLVKNELQKHAARERELVAQKAMRHEFANTDSFLASTCGPSTHTNKINASFICCSMSSSFVHTQAHSVPQHATAQSMFPSFAKKRNFLCCCLHAAGRNNKISVISQHHPARIYSAMTWHIHDTRRRPTKQPSRRLPRLVHDLSPQQHQPTPQWRQGPHTSAASAAACSWQDQPGAAS